MARMASTLQARSGRRARATASNALVSASGFDRGEVDPLLAAGRPTVAVPAAWCEPFPLSRWSEEASVASSAM
eukprot:scaffold173516_cov27-Tisochrysis_lutea.AAC.8